MAAADFTSMFRNMSVEQRTQAMESLYEMARTETQMLGQLQTRQALASGPLFEDLARQILECQAKLKLYTEQREAIIAIGFKDTRSYQALSDPSMSHLVPKQ
ncbi:MAG: hypothetical protein JSS32_09325 [Verrucomicrobia bacterium]|nr:hypothetical protein [Verrucomicrobiota bacterium]